MEATGGKTWKRRQNNGKTRDSSWNVTGLCVLTRVSYSLLSGLVSVSALGDFEPENLVWEPCCVIPTFLTSRRLLWPKKSSMSLTLSSQTPEPSLQVPSLM